MEQYSTFQLANPLSPKKFTKKFLSSFVLATLFWVPLSYFPASFIVATSGAVNVAQDAIRALERVAIWVVILYVIFLILRAMYLKAYIRRYYYNADEHFITIKKGVFTPTEIHVQYAKIQDVYVDQDIWDRLFGLYDVHIASATVTSGMEAHIDGVEKEVAERIKSTFFGRMTGARPSEPEVATPPPSQPVSLNREVSSHTYPPSNKYFVGSFLASFFASLVAAPLAAAYSITKNFGVTPLPIMIIATFALFIFSMLYSYVWFKNYSFSFEGDMIIQKTSFISRNETHIPYRSIQDVTLSQGLLDRMLGIASVRIQNAAQQGMPQQGVSLANGISLIAQPLDKANELISIVRDIVQRSRGSSSTGL